MDKVGNERKRMRGREKVGDKKLKKFGGKYEEIGFRKCNRWRKNIELNEGAGSRKNRTEGQVGSDITIA